MIYTLGASFTKWYWPTWADWLNVYNGPVTNWAFSGYSNQHIYWILLDRCNQITKDDTVIVMWAVSNNTAQWYDREWIDRNQCEGFFPATNGKLWFTNDTPWMGYYRVHPDHEVSLTNMIISTFNAILQTQMLLERIGCKYKMVFSQNPWLDVRAEYKPTFKYTWDEKLSISEEEYNHALNIMNMSPVAQLLKQIDWSTFIDAPSDVFDPRTYKGLWEYTFTKKDFVVTKNNYDNHPSSLANHDYLVERIMPQKSLHREVAYKVADDFVSYEIPAFTAEDFVGSPDRHMGNFNITVD